jgi:hypothetical protein
VISDDADARARMLSGLVSHLPEEKQPAVIAQALAAIAKSRDVTRAGPLAELVPHLPPDLLADTLAVTPKTSPETLAAILERGRAVLAQDADAAYADLLRDCLTDASRPACLRIISATAPAVAEIGGARSIQQCAQAAMKVRRWWP